MDWKRLRRAVLIISLLAGVLANGFAGAAAAETSSGVRTDAETAAEWGLLAGEGNGVNQAYLDKTTTRLQAAILSLKLQGRLQEALSYSGSHNFHDASLGGKTFTPMLAYLFDHPEYGWTGTGNGKFSPLTPISSQQFYKVLLEVLGYRTGTDFTYEETESFAAGIGLSQIGGTAELKNADIATALIEAASAKNKDGSEFFARLKSAGVIPPRAALPQGERISLRHDAKLGTFFADRNGRTLYFFTKDAEDLNACQGNCIANWPIYYSDELQVPASLNKADFGVFTRTDGTKQLTYKNWPLYYFVKDKSAGDVLGEAVGGVWFVAKSDYTVMLGTSAKLGNYLTDDYGRALYYFDKDTPQMSVCEGQCHINWPTYLSAGKSVPSVLKSDDFGKVTRSDGSKQTSFKGYPLYYFIKDEAHGDVMGQNVGNVWFVVDPAKFTGTKAAQQVKTYSIEIKEFSFGSAPLTVEAGSKIVFTNLDEMKHNAVAVDGSFATPLLAKGESFTVTVTKAGTIDYYCEPHKKFMKGRIIVK